MEYREKIIKRIEENEQKGEPTSLTDLKKLAEHHQDITRNVRLLLADDTIRIYIKVDKNIKRAVSITDNEIFFTLVNRYEHPQDIFKLIDETCSNDKSQASQAYTEVCHLIMEKGGTDAIEKFLKECGNKNLKLTVPLEPVKIEAVKNYVDYLMSCPPDTRRASAQNLAYYIITNRTQHLIQTINSFV